ncbi:ATP-binding protein [Aeoliella mucimassa]|uniref:histidine kinase n=1 Tax=Aeoliella mucimassa TaxID=2527972 RepID=A0A518AGZ7_9BACT|nr:ATP-binding protein [Aeoliella mucimassa]QDU53998.1 Sensor histidine kinase RegB [Aeoliella mucimassa]
MPVSTNAPTTDFPATRLAVNAPWLVKLRWVAIVGQLGTIGIVVFGLEIHLPVVPLLCALAVTAATNIALAGWVRWAASEPQIAIRQSSFVITGVMLLDLLVLSAMLFMTGGPTNPFVVFYFVNLALAGVLLEPAKAWLLEVAACLAMGFLFWRHWQVPVLSDPARLTSTGVGQTLPLAATGDLVALIAASGVIVWFMTRLTGELRASQQARRRAEIERARSEKLEALGTLAAGAAHELATPLSTIAVVANEVQRELAGRDLPAGIADDLALVRREIERCRSILHRMSYDAGQSIGEAPKEITVRQLVEAITSELATPERVTFEPRAGAAEAKLHVLQVALSQALRGLVQNGLDASTDVVTVLAEPAENSVKLTIIDRGGGMSPEVLARAGDPFFTTKQPGQGMGLGLFLARSVVERLGGQLQIHSTRGSGTQAVVLLPTTD